MTRWSAAAVRLLTGASAHPGGLALSARLLAALDLPPGAPVLDLGCGSGPTLRLQRRRGLAALGLDVDPVAVRRAARHGPVVRAEAHALPFPASSFAAVTCEFVLSTTRDPATVLAEVARTLRPGGRLGFTDVVVDRERLAAGYPEVLDVVDGLTTARSLDDWASLLVVSGLVVERVELCAPEVDALLSRLHRRLRLAGVLTGAVAGPVPLALAGGPRRRLRAALRVSAAARAAAGAGALGYVSMLARRPGAPAG